jgi:hypothetical protein
MLSAVAENKPCFLNYLDNQKHGLFSATAENICKEGHLSSRDMSCQLKVYFTGSR